MIDKKKKIYTTFPDVKYQTKKFLQLFTAGLLLWCAQRDLNPHGRPLDPKSSASANSAMRAYPHNIKSAFLHLILNGDPTGTRTRVTAVKGRCLNRLTIGPYR